MHTAGRWVVVCFALLAGMAFGQTPVLPVLPEEGRVKLSLRPPKGDKAKGEKKDDKANGEKKDDKANAAKNDEPAKGEKKDDKAKEEDQEEGRPVWKPWKPPGHPLTLGECLAIGQERQPAIAAATASLAAAERGYIALHGLRPIYEILSPDLPVRRLQAQRGLCAAAATVVQARQENTYDICRLYFDYVYATQQEQTAADIVEQLESFYDIARQFLQLPVPDPKVKVNEFSLGDIDAVIAEVRDLREEASTGRRKALAALKEAMAVPREFQFVPADTELPLMGGTVSEDTVVNLALSRRPELVQAAVVVDVTRLEVTAQARLDHRVRGHTFASGTDLHARHIAAPVRNGEYRPGAVIPEMPTEIVGTAADRVDRMTQYLRVNESAYLKATGLVQLEASNAYLNWEQATRRVKDSREAHERAQALVEKARTAAQTRLEPELLVRTESLASKAQAKYVKSVHELVRSLIALERVTAGGVVPAFKQR